MKKKRHPYLLVGVGTVIFFGLCLAATFTALGSGLALWFAVDKTAVQPSPTVRMASWSIPTLTPTSVHTVTPTSSPSPNPTSTATSTPLPSPTPTPSPEPTLAPTAAPTEPPPTAAPAPSPTATPAPPSFPFEIKETASFKTNHLDFDVYVAITDEDNRPLSGYRVIGNHSSGEQMTTQPSANDWTVNSGAMHYKAGNLKVTVPNSAGGTWLLQLVDEENNPAAPMVEFPFDISDPTWYFIIYTRGD